MNPTSLDHPPTVTRPERWRDRARGLLLGEPVGEELTPYEPAVVVPDPHLGRGSLRRNGLLVASTISGLLGTAIIVATAPVWRLDLFSKRLAIPGIPTPGSSFFAGASFLLGVCLLTVGWVILIGRSERQRWSEQRRLLMVAVVVAVWAVPLLFGPPLLSNDAYSYVAQGELASRGFDPTSHGPVYLGAGKIMSAADPVWRNAPAPYGPVAIGLSRLVVEITGHEPASALLGMRVLAIIGVVMSAVGVGLIARSYQVSPASAIAIGIANPLVLLHLVGGSHNDALMLGFLALGLAAVRADRRWLGIVLVAAATAVKLPAAAAFLFIGWTWTPVQVSLRRRAGQAGAVLAAGMAVVGVLCVLGGTGLGWITNLRGTGTVKTTFSATTRLGFVLSDGLHAVGLPVDQETVVSLTRLAGLLLAGGLSLLILLRSPQLGLVRAVGLVMIVVIVLGPVVWPWYLPPGFALLAGAGIGKYRPSYLVGVFAVSLLVFPTTVEGVPTLSRYQHVLALGVVVLIVGACFAAQWIADRARDRRIRRHRSDGTLPEAVEVASALSR
ncbi:polyprenol phosphomannose-dependent alpha 1,6 mannosyltransferase MptB [Rhabdothermincola sediminis]|uniref:polyprenol phosphomannose-dependent alpha 1,6 mannosyltransferase MptB n=1 Tax=Rhabdothermincola sediminis TaxID=2751370 RepID=UPI001AA0482E|nr:polyprenol phosphomannose-dependent alpha 1,6 mannosyltransferase MptB [Rhabdothermincola sediminis]